MSLVPLLLSGVPLSADIASSFNFCHSDDELMPFAGATFTDGDKQQFLGLFQNPLAGTPPPPDTTFGTGIGSFTLAGSGGREGVSGSGGKKGVGGNRS